MNEEVVFWSVMVFYWIVLGIGYGMLLFGWFMGPGA